jgi:hypothetical protein
MQKSAHWHPKFKYDCKEKRYIYVASAPCSAWQLKYNIAWSIELIDPLCVSHTITSLHEFYMDYSLQNSARKVFGHIESVKDPSSDSKSSRSHVWHHLPVFLYSFEVYSCIDSSKMIANSPKVSNFNRSLLSQTQPVGSSTTNRRFYIWMRVELVQRLPFSSLATTSPSHSLVPNKMAPYKIIARVVNCIIGFPGWPTSFSMPLPSPNHTSLSLPNA